MQQQKSAICSKMYICLACLQEYGLQTQTKPPKLNNRSKTSSRPRRIFERQKLLPSMFTNSLPPQIKIPYQRPKGHTSIHSTCEKYQPQLVFFSFESHLALSLDAPYHLVIFGHNRSLSIIGTDVLASSRTSFHRAS